MRVVCAMLFLAGVAGAGESATPDPAALAAQEKSRHMVDDLKKRLAGYDRQAELIVQAKSGKLTDEERKQLNEIDLVRANLRESLKSEEMRVKKMDAGEDYTAGVGDICPAHGVKMKRVRVPILYGLMIQRAPSALQEKAFPYAMDFHPGGCVISIYPCTEAWIYICPACQRAEKAWQAEHKTP
jgi:hypothetical protein